jgi:hypothetical protein
MSLECNIGPGKPNILHLSIRPADFVDDECTSVSLNTQTDIIVESSKKIPGIPRRSGGNGCCNCIIS